MLSDALTYPIQGDHTAEILVVGGLLSFITGVLATLIFFLGFATLGIGLIFLPVAYLPSLSILGYLVRVLKSTAQGETAPPEFDDIGRAFKDGIFASVISFVYYLLPGLVFLVSAGIGAGIGNEVGGLFGLLGFLVGTVLTIALTYVYPVALTRYALEDNIGAAFSFGSMTATLASVDYLVAWLFGFLILAVGGVLSGIVSLIPLLGWIIAPVVLFFFSIMAYRAFGLAYTSASASTRNETGATPA